MSKKSLDIMTCDRCSATEEIRRDHQAYSWGKMWFAQANGPTWVGTQDPTKSAKFPDLCPACIGDLMRWWKAPAEEPRP